MNLNLISEDSPVIMQIIEYLTSIKSDITKISSFITATSTSEWLTNSDVQKMLGVSSKTLQNYRKEGKIGFSQVSKKIYYRHSDVQNFLNKNYYKPFNIK